MKKIWSVSKKRLLSSWLLRWKKTNCSDYQKIYDGVTALSPFHVNHSSESFDEPYSTHFLYWIALQHLSYDLMCWWAVNIHPRPMEFDFSMAIQISLLVAFAAQQQYCLNSITMWHPSWNGWSSVNFNWKRASALQGVISVPFIQAFWHLVFLYPTSRKCVRFLNQRCSLRMWLM